MFVYVLSSCGFQFRCCHINFRYRSCLEQEVPWHSGNYRVKIHSETCKWHNNNIQSIRGNGDYKILQDFLKNFSPFKKTDSPDSIRNIVRKVHSSSKDNVDTMITVSSNNLSDTLTKGFAGYHFNSGLQVAKLVQTIRLSDKDRSVSVDSNLLFQHLTAILLSTNNNDNQINLSNLFSYQLWGYPASLADSLL